VEDSIYAVPTGVKRGIMFKKVVIIGVGLIGGSIGKAILERKLADEVIGVCRRQSSLDRAMNEKVITSGFVNNYPEAVKDADMVFIATPVEVIKTVLKDLAGVVEDKTIVTDAGSTKKEIVECAENLGNIHFVGSHPVAGSEKDGVEYANGSLFENAVCVVTPTDITPEHGVEKVKELWTILGSRVSILSPEEHDKLLAYTSHLPHIIAYLLAGIQKQEHYEYISTGLKDTTRIAGSDPSLWVEIIMNNKGNLLSALEQFKKMITDIENTLKKGDIDELKKQLTICREAVDGFRGKD
jgi:prephenate dehydrogenase